MDQKCTKKKKKPHKFRETDEQQVYETLVFANRRESKTITNTHGLIDQRTRIISSVLIIISIELQ